MVLDHSWAALRCHLNCFYYLVIIILFNYDTGNILCYLPYVVCLYPGKDTADVFVTVKYILTKGINRLQK